MKKSFNSYREQLADALTPKPATPHANVVVLTDIQFKPSRAALVRAEEVRQRVRTEMAELRSGSSRSK
jgi:hypothetical protein